MVSRRRRDDAFHGTAPSPLLAAALELAAQDATPEEGTRRLLTQARGDVVSVTAACGLAADLVHELPSDTTARIAFTMLRTALHHLGGDVRPPRVA
jgi:hypothetical protein